MAYLECNECLEEFELDTNQEDDDCPNSDCEGKLQLIEEDEDYDDD